MRFEEPFRRTGWNTRADTFNVFKGGRKTGKPLVLLAHGLKEKPTLAAVHSIWGPETYFMRNPG